MTIKVACCQMQVTDDLEKNLATAEQMVKEASNNQADIVLLPEMFCCPYDNACFPDYAQPEGGSITTRMRALAKECGVYLFAGSYPELNDGKIYNTCFVYDRMGNRIGRHRKVHLFDISVEGGVSFCESDVLSAGNEITTVETEYGTIGVAICFDMRFVEPFRLMALHGAKMVMIPAAFNMTTGPAHWELTLRSRALDHQLFAVSCAPAQDLSASYHSYGHSIVTSPWGEVITQLDFESGIAYAEIDLDEVDRIRKQLPILSARRTDLYELTQK